MKDNSNNIPELLSPFDQLREVDGEGKEWWNSRKYGAQNETYIED